MDGVSRTLKNERISNALNGDHGGTLVIADTKHQVLNKACNGEMRVSIYHFVFGKDTKQCISTDLNSYQRIQGKNSRRKIRFNSGRSR